MLFLAVVLAMVFQIMMPITSTVSVPSAEEVITSDPSALPAKLSTNPTTPVTTPAKTHGINVIGFTHEDSNNNGKYDGGEPRVTHMQIFVYDSATPTKQITTIFSDANGNFSVATNITKNLLLKSTTYNGYVPTKTHNEFSADSHGAQLGFRKLADTDLGQLGTIQGEVYEDKNGNSARDSGEGGMYFNTIYLVDGNGSSYNTVEGAQATENNGQFRYEHLPLDKTYTLKLVNPTGAYSIQKSEYGISINAAQKNISGLEIPVKRN